MNVIALVLEIDIAYEKKFLILNPNNWL